MDSQDAFIGSTILRRASVTGIGINLVFQFVTFAVQLAYQILMARLLIPSDFGLVAMAAPILNLAQLLTSFGLSHASVQRTSITQVQLSFLFWTSVGLGSFIAVCILALAPIAQWFYKEPAILPIVMALAGLPVLTTLGAQHSAVMLRRLQFIRLAAANLISLVVGTAVGIAAAEAKYGVWAIIASQYSTAFASIILIWSLSGWRPNFHFWAHDVGALLAFGGNLTAFNFANYFARNLDNILIGRVWGQAELGLYDRAYRLMTLPLSQVMDPFSRVALPVLSKSVDDAELYRRIYFRMLETLMLVIFPASIYAFSLHDQLIILVLGSKWAGVAPIFAILAIGAVFAPISHSVSWLLTSQNRTRQLRNWGIISSLGFAAAIVIGLPFGAIGVAASYIAYGVVQGPVLWWLVTREGPISFRNLGSKLFPYVVSSLITLVSLHILKNMLPTGGIVVASLFFLAYLAFALALLATANGRAALADVIVQARILIFRNGDVA